MALSHDNRDETNEYFIRKYFPEDNYTEQMRVVMAGESALFHKR